MRKRIYTKLEGALCVGLAAALLLSCAGVRTQATLADKLLRLHVIANSDSPEDQALKLRVRDRILREAEAVTAGADSEAAAEAAVEAALPALERAAEETVTAAGYGYPVRLYLEECWFPTKAYGAFALPAGRYRALRAVIGAGEGENWWCVLFPPLCTAAVFADTAAAAGVTEEELRFMRTEDGYELRFRAAEWIARLREWLRR